jgi:hypothetical protein
MKKVLGHDFGEWNLAVFWLVKYLQTKYGATYVYPTEIDIRAACFPPAPKKKPNFSKAGKEGFGVFITIKPNDDEEPIIKSGVRTNRKHTLGLITDELLPEMIENWFQQSCKKFVKP